MLRMRATDDAASRRRSPLRGRAGAREVASRPCRPPGPCRSGPRRRRRTAPPRAPPPPRGSLRHPALEPALDRGQHPAGVALVELGRVRPARHQQLVEVGADDPVGAGRGERVAGAAVGREQRPSPSRSPAATSTVPAFSSPSLPSATNGITSTQTAANRPKTMKGRLLIGSETYRLTPTCGALGASPPVPRTHPPQPALARSAAAGGRRGGRGGSG